MTVSSTQVLPGGFELPLEPRLPRIGAVDQVALEERAASLAKRSIKKESKLQALELAVRMMDLTTLEGADTPGKVAALAAKAIQPDPADPSVPSCAAICVYPNLVPAARERVHGTGVKVASVATAFPSGQSPLAVKLHDVEEAVAFGADEIDMVIDRGAFLSGRHAKVYDEIVRVKEACGHAHLKAIQNLVIVNETLGPDWLTPDRFRLGASSLLNDVLMQIRTQKTGRYQNPEYFTRD